MMILRNTLFSKFFEDFLSKQGCIIEHFDGAAVRNKFYGIVTKDEAVLDSILPQTL
jgi:hypothetical protein